MRLGFMVGAAPLIAEARALRRLMHRTAPLNNQRTAAIFLAEGHYQGLVRTLRVSMKQRWDVATRAVDLHIPDVVRPPSTGGSSIWLRLPDGLAETGLGDAARRRGCCSKAGRPSSRRHRRATTTSASACRRSAPTGSAKACSGWPRPWPKPSGRPGPDRAVDQIRLVTSH
ncbi:hypothetical protein ACFQ4K_28360 [Tistrella bauzanensis]